MNPWPFRFAVAAWCASSSVGVPCSDPPQAPEEPNPDGAKPPTPAPPRPAPPPPGQRSDYRAAGRAHPLRRVLRRQESGLDSRRPGRQDHRSAHQPRQAPSQPRPGPAEARSRPLRSGAHAARLPPARLKVLAPCKTVTGVVDLIRIPEPDGDTHVNIKLDAGQESLIHRPGVTPGSSDDYDNMRFQLGDLVTEPICQHQVIQPDAKAACAGFRDPIQIPPVGSHVQVTGVYVLDTDHGWTELHPVSTIKRIG